MKMDMHMVANMTTFVILRHPVTIFVTYLTNPDNLTSDILILDCMIILLCLRLLMQCGVILIISP